MNERFSLDIATLTNSTIAQLRVEELNSVLQENSTTLGAKLISNDTSFRLADGLPNDGYLSADGLHLNYRGTIRLATKHRLIRLDIYFLLVSSNACYCSCIYLIIKSFKRFIYPVSISVVAPPRFEPV